MAPVSPTGRPGSSGHVSLVVAIAAAVLLVVLAVLQYRWTGELSAAANERLRANLEESSRLLASDIDAPLTRLYNGFLRAAALTDPRRSPARDAPELFEDLLGRVVEEWRRHAAFPDILDETWVVLVDRRDGTRDVFRFDESSGRLEAGRGPEGLDDLLASLQRPGQRPPSPRADRLVAPIPTRGRGGRPGAPAGLIVATLNTQALEEEMLPALIDRHFGAVEAGGAPEYVVTVIDRSSSPPRQIYPSTQDSNPARNPTPAEPADIAFPAFRSLALGATPGDRGRPDFRRYGRDTGQPTGPTERRRRARGGPPSDSSGGAWLVRITHRHGSLEAATNAARRRNLYISSGALFLVAVGFALVLISARRAQALAAQQVDFVAGVSHELNTPLQAIRSAGENLRAGVVHRPDDIRGYGEMIEREGRRLARLVEQALQWAGIGRSSARQAAAEIDLGELLRMTVAESNWFLEENGAELDFEGLDDLPQLRGDRTALISVFTNLLHNATKYGRADDGAVRVRVDASCNAERRQITVAVTDHGPGIAKAEQRRIFEPFVRGRTATESTLPGSGLGLSLARNIVEEHGGSITVDSEPGRTTFRVVLPTTS